MKGLANELQQWRFVTESATLTDALRCLKQLPLYLLSREANVINAFHNVKDIQEKVHAIRVRDWLR